MKPEESKTLYELLCTQAAGTPNAPAIVSTNGQAMSYGHLLHRLDSFRTGLSNCGIGRNDRVALVMPDGPEMALALLAVTALGACCPLNPNFREREFDFYLSELSPRALVVKSGDQNPVTLSARKLGIPIVELESTTKDLGRGLLSPLATDATSGHVEAARAADTALILHTSGTTSRPKLVPLSHSNLLSSARHVAVTAGLRFEDRCLNVMPLFHIHGLSGALLSSLWAGASIVCAPGFEAEHFSSWLGVVQPTWYTAVPAIHQAVLSCAEVEPEIATRHTLRFIRSSSAPLPERVRTKLEEIFRVPVIEAYGMTEAAHQIASNPLPPQRRKSASVGLAAGPQLSIMNESGRLLSPGMTGEIVVRGASVMAGYLDNPQANEQSFFHGWFRTGDTGYIDKDGYLFLTGRIKDVINRGGEKISPREIDEVISQHPSVAEAVAFAVPHATLGEDIAAAVVLGKNHPASEADLKRFVAARVAPFKIPRIILIVDAIPKTSTGKIQRAGLAEKFGMGASPGTGSKTHEPGTDAETALLQICSDVLGVGPLSPEDNFFQSGGDSLRAAQVISRVREILKVELPIAAFFEASTIANLAQYIGEHKDQSIGAIAHEISDRDAAPGSDAPLSFAQERLWFLDRLNSGTPVYNRALALRLSGTLNTHGLQDAINEIIRRHAVLRSSFPHRGGRPIQVAAPSLNLNLEIHDFSTLPPGNREIEARRAGQREARRLFDVARAPLCRALLLRLGENEQILIWLTHHIIFDGWSEGIFLEELAALYGAFRAGQTFPLPPLTTQYQDHTLAQRDKLESQKFAADLEYWKLRLKDLPKSTDLPFDRPRPAIQRHHGAAWRFKLPAPLAEKLEQLSRREKVTLFMTLLAAFYCLLFRYTAQNDIAVGVPVAGRSPVEAEKLIGVFFNTLVLRTELSESVTFRQLLEQVRRVSIEAYSHQDVPFEKLVEVLLSGRDLSRTPLFQVMFQLRNFATRTITLSEVAVEPFDLDIGVAHCDLTLEVARTVAGLECRFEYNTDLFDSRTIERMTGHFQTLLQAVCTEPEREISRLPMLTESERRQVLVEWNNTQRDYPKDRCVHQLFEEQSKLSPESAAVVCGDKQLTYGELNRRANRLADFLRQAGVGPEVVVAICMERSLEMVIGMLGVLKAGGAYLPLDAGNPEERLALMVEDAQAAILLTHAHSNLHLTQFRTRTVRLDVDLAEFAGHSHDNPEARTTVENLAYVIYTSGSSGKPKAVEITHGGLLNLIHWHQETYGVSERDRATQLASLGFDACVWELWPYLAAGASVYVADDGVRTAPAKLWAWLKARAITISFLPTPLAELALQEPVPADMALRLLLTGGDRLRRGLQTALPFRVVNHYGPTENSVVSTCGEVAATPLGVCPPIGRPIANTSVYILDSCMQPQPVGVPGEIYLGGAGLARGYLHRPELTAEKFLPNLFGGAFGARLYRTGDVARYLSDGNLEFLGRLDNQVKIGALRIELNEIEAALGQHPQVRQAVVLALERQPDDKRLVAYVASSQPSMASPRQLREFLKRKLPAYMIPSAFMFLDSLPLNANGKVDPKALPEPDPAAFMVAREPLEPRSAAEHEIAQVWAEVLGTNRIATNVNFFDVGGNSLLAIRITARINERFGIDVSVRHLLDAATITGLAILVESLLASKKREQGLAIIGSDCDDIGEI